MMKYYYKSLYKVNSVITIIILSLKPNKVIYMFFKAIKNFISPNKLFTILLVFYIYFKINELNISYLLITQYKIATKKSIDEF